MSADANTSNLQKVLGARALIALSFGAMIGWSWVLLSANWVNDAGWLGAPLAFLIGGLAIVLIGLLYAELASSMPKTGGEHVYVLRALGPNASFWCSWALLMAYATVCVFEAVALPTGVEYLLPQIRFSTLWSVEGSPVDVGFVLIGVLGTVLVTWANYLGIRTAAVVQTIATSIIVACGLLLMFGAGLNGSTEAATAPFAHGIAGITAVIIMVPAMLVGFDVIPQSAGEIDLPPRRLGILLAISVAFAVLWYALISLSVGLGISAEQLNDSPAMGSAVAASNLWQSPLAGRLLVLGGIGGILTSWNAFVLGASRLMYAMASDGMLPKAFARLHPRYSTPHIAILSIGVACALAPLAGRTILVWLVDAGSFTIVIAYIFVAIAFLALRKNEPDMPRPFRLPAGQTIGRLALVSGLCLFCLYLPFSPSGLLWPQEWLIVLGMGLLGGLVFATHREAIGQLQSNATVDSNVDSRLAP